MTFDQLNLHPRILKALAEADYNEPTPIQAKAIPQVLGGFDLRASAQTGTGKTAAFLLPALNILATPKPGKGPRVLILAPTRELAMQINEQAIKYSQHLTRIRSVCLFGGVPYHAQARQLSRPHDMIIATPGRLIDWIERKKIDLSRVEIMILDEADRMLDMGFVEPVNMIAAKTPKDRQTLLFSATLKGEVMKLSERLLTDPIDIVIHAEKARHDNIDQKLHFVDNLGHKNRLLDHILRTDGLDNAIVFTSTKRHADQLVAELRESGHRASALHGDMNQRQRTKTIARLKEGKFNILVATDVAARGIDVQSITHVINFDLPNNAEDYVHRIGRTGRAGAHGTALSFAAHKDSMMVKKIEKFTGHKLLVSQVEGLEPRQQNKPARSRQRPHRGGPGGPSRGGPGGPPRGGPRNGPKRRFSRKPRG